MSNAAPADDWLPAWDDGLRRLKRLIEARAGKFQLLLCDCRDQRLRQRLIAALDADLAATGAAARIDLAAGDVADWAGLEMGIAALAQDHRLVHVLGGSAWFTPERWRAANLRREALAQSAPAAIVLWLDPESIAACAQIAIDLWAWRSSVIRFAGARYAPASEPPQPDLPEIDTRDAADRRERIAYLQEALDDDSLPDDLRFLLTMELADHFYMFGDLDQAEVQARRVMMAASQPHEQALSWSFLASVLASGGDLDNALRICREDVLPVFEHIGNQRMIALSKCTIAEFLYRGGDLDEALRIYREDVLPVFERTGNQKLIAITMGNMADVLQQRGELDEALRIYREEALPVFEAIGDPFLIAETMIRIADVLYQRGELDEALRVYREEALPVFERFGDQRSRAITLERIAAVEQERDGDTHAPAAAVPRGVMPG